MKKSELRQLIKEEIQKLDEFESDLKRQLIVLMGLPAAGKSTFVKTKLKKYFPQSDGYSVSNSDNQVVRYQYMTATQHLDFIKNKIKSKNDLLKFIEKTKFKGASGATIKLPIKFEDLDRIKSMNIRNYFKEFFKPYYAIYFDIRGLAKMTNDKLFKEKIWKGNDIIVIDTTGTNTVNVFKKMKQLDEHGYNVNIIYLENDPELSISRDEWRKEHEGRGVGASVIMSYANNIHKAFKEYQKDGNDPNGIIDRMLHFKWIPKGDSPIEGKWQLMSDNRYEEKRKIKKNKVSELTESTLIFNASSKQDFMKMKKVISKKQFHAEENLRDLYFEFPEEDLDNLEKELQKHIDKNDIGGYFESSK